MASQACATGSSGSSAVEREHEHDMMTLVSSGYLERLGFDYRPADPAEMYREPHKIRHRLSSSW